MPGRLVQTTTAGARGFAPLALPAEYLRQGEGAMVPPRPRFRLGYPVHGRRGFTLCGHRLSSLYRRVQCDVPVLTKDYPAPSPCGKYSPGVWGWKTPTATGNREDAA